MTGGAMSEQIEVPDAWKALAARIEHEGGMALLLGASDAGKTTLAQWLLRALAAGGRRVALLDGDIGQSTIGPPATAGLAFVASGSTDPPLEPIALRFIGAVSPSGVMLPLVAALKRLAEKALASGADVLLVDTTGLVLGPLGRRLKFHKIELLAPRHLIALQREAELEPILRLFEGRPGLTISRLPVSPHVIPRSAEFRRAYRVKRFGEYLQASSLLQLSLHHVGLLGEPWPDEQPLTQGGGLGGAIRGLLLGLADAEDDLLALGLLHEIDPASGTLVCLTPWNEPERVRILHLGTLRLDPSGEDLGDPAQESVE